MNLVQAFRLGKTPCLALVGAGGKSTALFMLALELTLRDQPVIVTTTTHLHVDQLKLADSHWMGEKPEDFPDFDKKLRGITLLTGKIRGDRSLGISPNLMAWLREICISRNLPLLIEADGSRQRPLKAPAGHEPVIPGFVETVVVVAGLEGLDKPLSAQYVHRPEIVAKLGGLQIGDPVTSAALVRVLTHPAGGLKNIPPHARRLALLNQVDTPVLQARVKGISEQLLPIYHAVIAASLNPSSRGSTQQSIIHAVYEPVAGIILAAGGSSRFGRPKQLLDWHGKPFVRVVAETALSAGLFPVVVVTGAQAKKVESALKDLPVSIVRNTAWEKGQSTSIQAGLAGFLSPRSSINEHSSIASAIETAGVEAAIFLLVDQPQITPAVIAALVGEHARTLAQIVVPRVADQRANPVLFDRLTFPELMALSGDEGGRAILTKFPVTYLPWLDESLLTDVDTPDDYRELVNGA